MDSKTRGKLQRIVRDTEDKLVNTLLYEAIVVSIEKVSNTVKELRDYVDTGLNKAYTGLEELYKKVVRIDDRLQKIEKRRIKDGKDGYTPVKGVDYTDGKDGYTPVKGKDYRDGIDGKKGEDGYTPVKGMDYDDGKDGKDGVTKIVEKELSGSAIIEKIEKGKRKLDASAIKNLPQATKETVIKEIHRIGSQGTRDFKRLRDVPQSYSGQAGKIVKVRTDEKGLEFGTGGSGEGTYNHSELDNLEYANSGHTGFQPAGSYLTEDDLPTVPSDISELTDTTGVIPTNTNELTNGAGFITSGDIPAIPDDISDLADSTGIIPIDTGDLTNNAGFITSNDVPAIPADVSELTDTTNLLGDATSIQGFNITTTDPSDGSILVYRDATSEYVLEAKPVAGANPSAADVSFTPTGDLSADDVQEALVELDTEKTTKNFAIAMAIAL